MKVLVDAYQQPNLFPNPTIASLWCVNCQRWELHFLEVSSLRITCNGCGFFKTDIAIGPKLV